MRKLSPSSSWNFYHDFISKEEQIGLFFINFCPHPTVYPHHDGPFQARRGAELLGVGAARLSGPHSPLALALCPAGLRGDAGAGSEAVAIALRSLSGDLASDNMKSYLLLLSLSTSSSKSLSPVL